MGKWIVCAMRLLFWSHEKDKKAEGNRTEIRRKESEKEDNARREERHNESEERTMSGNTASFKFNFFDVVPSACAYP